MTSVPDACYLCGLPLRYARIPLTRDDHQVHFCCQGCRQVYLMLAEVTPGDDPARFRQTELYRRCVEMGVIPRSEDDLATFAERPHPPHPGASRAGAGAGDPDGALAIHLVVEGMWCPACAWVIEETLRRQSGIMDVRCNFSTDRLRCAYDPTRSSPDAIREVIQRLGYDAHPPDELTADQERRRQFVRFAVSAFLTMNVMMLSFALYSGFVTALEADDVWKISWPMFFMATAVMVYGGLPLHRKGLAGILRGQPGMEALISIGAISAYGYSVFNLLQGGSLHLYFDTTCMLIILVQLGKILERQAKDRIQKDLGHYYALMPAKVRLCPRGDSRGRYVAAAQLAPGDLFRITIGEIAAADGRVVEGQGMVDESSLTGEAQPRPKRAGDRLISGTRVIEGNYLVRAENVGRSSTLGQMLAVMDAALNRKTVVEGRTDKLLRVFVPVMVLLAATTALVLLARGAVFEQAFIRGLTVLVISCPCALGVAVPLARVAGVSLAARKGILVQDFRAFDWAERIDTVVFDKTGTLTQGRWQLQSVVPMADLAEHDILSLAAGLEQAADHPIAVEIRRVAEARQITALPLAEVTVHDRGVSGRQGNRALRLGSADFSGAADGGQGASRLSETKDGAALVSWIYLAIDGHVVARLGFGDRLKKGARSAIRHLHAKRWDLRLVSGDSQASADQVGGLLGLDEILGNLRPVEKARIIEDLRRAGRFVAMVGDGVNDAPALATADLSVAVFAGRQLGEEAQAVTLMQGDPLQLPAFLTFATRVNRKIEQNLWGSFIYNLVSIPIAMAGWLSPLVAVIAMLLSSLSVTGNTLLLIQSEKRSSPESGSLRPQAL